MKGKEGWCASTSSFGEGRVFTPYRGSLYRLYLVTKVHLIKGLSFCKRCLPFRAPKQCTHCTQPPPFFITYTFPLFLVHCSQEGFVFQAAFFFGD